MTNLSETTLVLLAGGLGTRITEETIHKPKPMIEIGGEPILFHIMRYFSTYGVRKFVVCCGYKGHKIKEFFKNYKNLNSDLVVNLGTGELKNLNTLELDWEIKLIDTGLHTMTGGRLKKIKDHISGNQNFFMTYGDGLSDIDIDKLYDNHLASGCKVTLSAVKPPARFGALEFKNEKVLSFSEKLSTSEAYINGGFFVMNKNALDVISSDETSWEREPLEEHAKNGDLNAYKHDGFWQPMDTVRDHKYLEDLWKSKPPWKRW
jgi:glucose-1-phosphate cytidylyltransferase